MEIQMVLHLPHDAESVPISRQVLDGCLRTLGVTADTRADIALALSEACANVILHAGADDEYQVQVSARNGQCAIEVINGGQETGNGRGPDGDPAEVIDFSADPVPITAEHGRGLKIIDAVVDNMQLTSDERLGTTVHFEKKLQWVPGAPGEHLFKANGGSS